MGKRSKILLSIVLPVRNEPRLMDLCSALSEQDLLVKKRGNMCCSHEYREGKTLADSG